ncbi:hypothetical protein B8A39_09415 [Dolosigranulum pigrum]|uniref:Panacea domain-containing protein n=1 Tax=Dolosigranulum pigrum TaxID=29394 RepID=UPI000DC013D5|nr:type II toxin-antitoxin system antitoxin SocA domain-containing protein [Dolosigranulum pigrum]QTJ33066.1 DUF4065 domain-containing protein [Dolosigranulum pigrum]RAN50607.1 hypothetical protein B8A39_09415 [Dolosigranulum pigrum]
MVRHLIYIYKVPESTRRIGFVYSSNEPIYHRDLPEKLIELLERFELSIHRITTDEISIDSIVTKDAFFDDIEFYTDLDLFSITLKKAVASEMISPVDFSKLILSKFQLDKLQIQKVLYLIYSECLTNGIKLFDISPVAFDYGPVFEDVYQEYKHEPNKAHISTDVSVDKLATLSKTVYSPRVREITEKVMKAVNSKRRGSLIDITHANGGPWDQVYEKGANNIITDSVISKYNDKVLDQLYE